MIERRNTTVSPALAWIVTIIVVAIIAVACLPFVALSRSDIPIPGGNGKARCRLSERIDTGHPSTLALNDGESSCRRSERRN